MVARKTKTETPEEKKMTRKYTRKKTTDNSTVETKPVQKTTRAKKKVPEVSPNDEYVTKIFLASIVTQAAQVMILKTHPVGSVYISFDDINPSDLFGGQWERIKGRFLLASDDTKISKMVGGSSTHILSKEEMPEHSHDRGDMEIKGMLRTRSELKVGSGAAKNLNRGCFSFDEKDSHTNVMETSDGNSQSFLGVDRTINFLASNSWTGETSTVGESKPFSIMPPYVVVNVWRRVV